MKLAWFLAVSLAGYCLAAGCSVTPRSDDYVCVNPGDCTDGRTCVSGWCVFVDASVGEPGVDAGPGGQIDGGFPLPPDAGVCPAACTTCFTGGICIIDCNDPTKCASGVVCPAGMTCTIGCAGDNACEGPIDCSDSAACTVVCSGDNSCTNDINCGTGRCRVECIGKDSCTGIIDCQDACACDTSCVGTGSCANDPLCLPNNQCTNGSECTSAGGPCNRC